MIPTLTLAAIFVACGSPCDSNETLAEFAQEKVKEHFPSPNAVEYTLDSVYFNDAGLQVVRGRVRYGTPLGVTRGWSKYWIGVDCKNGNAEVKWLDVDDHGPKWGQY
jgi:hypothetical protein